MMTMPDDGLFKRPGIRLHTDAIFRALDSDKPGSKAEAFSGATLAIEISEHGEKFLTEDVLRKAIDALSQKHPNVVEGATLLACTIIEKKPELLKGDAKLKKRLETRAEELRKRLSSMGIKEPQKVRLRDNLNRLSSILTGLDRNVADMTRKAKEAMKPDKSGATKRARKRRPQTGKQ
ncbi:MAG: hypothetical protein ABIG39_04650 [Candidatus Micrarchaeota archaeon]